MGRLWTPSGPTVAATASATLFNFADQVEGVARFQNLGADVGRITLQNASDGFPDKYSLILPDQSLYVAFGDQQNYVKIEDASVEVTPGYMNKKEGEL
jgi:hypothetical protein